MERWAGGESKQNFNARLPRKCRAAAIFAAAILLGAPTARTQGAKHVSASRGTSPENNAPLRFEANRGEADPNVKYLARAGGYSVFLASEEADVVLHHETQPAGPVERGKVTIVAAYASVLRMRFADANLPTRIAPVDFADEEQFPNRTTNGAAAGIVYRGIYPGTDIVFHGNQKRMGIDLVLSPGADAAGIVLEVEGTTKITLDAAGNAVLHAGAVSLVLAKPSFYEARAGLRRPIVGRYQIEARNRLRFVAGAAAEIERVVID